MFFRKKSKRNTPFCSVVVAAAGSSTRMEGENKITALLGGVPVLIRTLRTLEQCPLVDEIIIVTQSQLIPWAGEACREFGLTKVTKILVGGDTRVESVLHGVTECSPKVELIAIQDGARPFLTQDILCSALETAAVTGAAAPAVPMKDTVKEAENGVVVATPARERLFAVQTPQVFEASLLTAALTQAHRENAPITDDCSAVERLGMKVTLTQGSYENIKITTPVDLALGEAILAWREKA